MNRAQVALLVLVVVTALSILGGSGYRYLGGAHALDIEGRAVRHDNEVDLPGTGWPLGGTSNPHPPNKHLVANRLAEIAAEYLRKGSQVYIEGKLRTRKWQGQDGQDRYTTEIIADEMQMLGGRGGAGGGSFGGGGGQQGGGQQGSGGQQGGGGNAPPQPGPDDFDDDIPF